MDEQTPLGLLELLDDLAHDLGKHMLLPISLLPEDADEASLREALGQALLRTQSGPSGTRSARGLWDDFCVQVKRQAVGQTELAGLAQLQARVQRALGWEARVDDIALQERAALTADLKGVRDGIAQLMQEVEREA